MCYNIFLTDVLQVALWDRTFGGATLILHVEGTTRPNAPRRPEHVKADVYFPGYLIEEDPRISPIVSELVQRYITDIGIPVIERWERCARTLWTLTQGDGHRIPPPYPSQPMQPNAIPRKSSTFVYHGRPVISPSPHDTVIVDEYEEEELTPSMLEMINMIEERDSYKSQLDTVQAALSATEQALSESLAREEDLNHQLENATVIMSTSMDGADSNVNVGRGRAGSASRHGSPTPHTAHHTASPARRIAHHTLPVSSPLALRDRFDRFSPTPASPRYNAFASPSRRNPIARRLFANPSEGPGEPEVSTTTREIVSLTDFLEDHDIAHLSSTLDVIRRNLPISLWPAELVQVGVSSTLIDRLIISMVAAGEV
jgi:hypothetical protein